MKVKAVFMTGDQWGELWKLSELTADNKRVLSESGIKKYDRSVWMNSYGFLIQFAVLESIPRKDDEIIHVLHQKATSSKEETVKKVKR